MRTCNDLIQVETVESIPHTYRKVVDRRVIVIGVVFPEFMRRMKRVS